MPTMPAMPALPAGMPAMPMTSLPMSQPLLTQPLFNQTFVMPAGAKLPAAAPSATPSLKRDLEDGDSDMSDDTAEVDSHSEGTGSADMSPAMKKRKIEEEADAIAAALPVHVSMPATAPALVVPPNTVPAAAPVSAIPPVAAPSMEQMMPKFSIPAVVPAVVV